MKKVVVHWKIRDVHGHGHPVSRGVATAWVKKMNLKYGKGTHWIKEVDETINHKP